MATVADSRINAVPLITSNARGGVTTRLEPLENGHGVGSGGIGTARRGAGAGGGGGNGASTGTGVSGRPDDGLSAALLDKVRALDALPRLGALKTLDLRGNDLRVSICLFIFVYKRSWCTRRVLGGRPTYDIMSSCLDVDVVFWTVNLIISLEWCDVSCPSAQAESHAQGA